MKWRYGMRGMSGPAVKELFEHCATSLAMSVRRMVRAGVLGGQESHNLTARFLHRGRRIDKEKANLFIAADMMPGADFSESMKWTIDNETRRLAGEALGRVFRQLKPVTWPTVEPTFLSLDDGYKGILDKLVCMKSTIYLTAPIECGGGHTFSEEIRSWRQRHGKLSDSWVYAKE